MQCDFDSRKTAVVQAPEDDLPESDGDDVKEVFAFYGLAAYYSQVLEKGLVNVVVLLRCSGVAVTREVFEGLFARHDRSTFGQLLVAARQVMPVPSEVDDLLSEALSRRNRLVHQFFADHSVAFTLSSGRREMIQELRELTKLFVRAERALRPIEASSADRLGLTEERRRLAMQEMLSEYLGAK